MATGRAYNQLFSLTQNNGGRILSEQLALQRTKTA